jgi:hypothetical protein
VAKNNDTGGPGGYFSEAIFLVSKKTSLGSASRFALSVVPAPPSLLPSTTPPPPVSSVPPTGRNLVRLSDSLFFAPQSDSEKKEKRHSKEPREKRPHPGSFCRQGGSFFLATQGRTSERQVWPCNKKKMAHIKPILCVFGTLLYSSGYTAPEMHHQQANIIQTARAGAWPVWLIW